MLTDGFSKTILSDIIWAERWCVANLFGCGIDICQECCVVHGIDFLLAFIYYAIVGLVLWDIALLNLCIIFPTHYQKSLLQSSIHLMIFCYEMAYAHSLWQYLSDRAQPPLVTWLIPTRFLITWWEKRGSRRLRFISGSKLHQSMPIDLQLTWNTLCAQLKSCNISSFSVITFVPTFVWLLLWCTI